MKTENAALECLELPFGGQASSVLVLGKPVDFRFLASGNMDY